jgi:photosystem II stability/assembly factor-like uncharacterized protein
MVPRDAEQRGKTVIATSIDQSWRSTDGGSTWTKIPALRAMDAAFGDSGLVLLGMSGSEIGRSTDDGQSWTRIETDAEGFFWHLIVSHDTAFAVAVRGVYRSLDAGVTWQRRPLPDVTFSGLARSGPNLIAVGGAGMVARSTDYGDTWHTTWLEGSDMISGVALADDRTAVIVGSSGTVLRSTDAGATWAPVTSPARAHLRAIAFASPTEGVAVGFWGEAIRTEDGGATWAREASGTRQHLTGVSTRPGGGFLVSGTRDLILPVTPGSAR